MRRLSLRAGPARRSSPTTLRTPTHVSGYYSDSSYEFDFRSDPDEPESETFMTEQPLSGPATDLVITSTPSGRFVYWPDRKPADLTDGNSRYVVYLDSLPFQEGTPLGLKVVELGRDNPNIISLSHLNMKTKSNSERSEKKTKTNLRDINRFENELIRSGTCRTRSEYEKTKADKST
jgi:hypothetical protein